MKIMFWHVMFIFRNTDNIIISTQPDLDMISITSKLWSCCSNHTILWHGFMLKCVNSSMIWIVCALLFMHVCPYACFVIYMYVGFKSSSELMLYVLYSDFKSNLYLYLVSVVCRGRFMGRVPRVGIPFPFSRNFFNMTLILFEKSWTHSLITERMRIKMRKHIL